MNKPRNQRRLGLGLLLVAVMAYGAIYALLRYRGDIVALEEQSSRRSYVRMEPADSDVVWGQLFDPSLAKQEIDKLIKGEERRKRFLKIVFGPAMFLEGFAQEQAINRG